MELAFLVAHRAHRRFASKPSTKVEADVRGTQAVAVHRKLAALILVDAQAPNLGRPRLFHLLPRPAWTETLAARLRRAVVGRQRHGLLAHVHGLLANGAISLGSHRRCLPQRSHSTHSGMNVSMRGFKERFHFADISSQFWLSTSVFSSKSLKVRRP